MDKDIEMDPIRKLVADRIHYLQWDMATLSKRVGKNHAYIQQFLKRGSPKTLPATVQKLLEMHLKLEPGTLDPGPTHIDNITDDVIAEIGNQAREASDQAHAYFRETKQLIPELKTAGGLGAGGIDFEEFNRSDGKGSVTNSDVIKAEWLLPRYYLESELGVAASSCRVIRVVGDSMHPTLSSGDRVLVDITDRSPSPPGIFVLWDGIGVVVKRLEVLPNMDPPMVRIISDNQSHSPYERTVDEIQIVGRVVWRAHRI